MNPQHQHSLFLVHTSWKRTFTTQRGLESKRLTSTASADAYYPQVRLLQILCNLFCNAGVTKCPSGHPSYYICLQQCILIFGTILLLLWSTRSRECVRE